MSRAIDIRCWKYGHEQISLPIPFARYEECRSYKANLAEKNTELINARMKLAELFCEKRKLTNKEKKESSTEAENALIELRRSLGAKSDSFHNLPF